MATTFSSPWPDPNSHVLSKIDFGVPLVELFKWLDVRDTLLGLNYKKQDITAALALACDCKHPDAVWLTSTFEGKDAADEAKNVFLLHPNDARAVCLAWWLNDDLEGDFLRRVTEMGNSFAASTLLCAQVWGDNDEECFRLAHLAALQHEQDGFRLLGHCFREGIGCEKDLNLAKENFLIAAELGHVYAARDFAFLLDESDPARWLWLGRAAFRGSPDSFVYGFSKQVDLFFSGSGNATVVFLIGRALKANIDEEKERIFGYPYKFDSWIGPANQAVSFYDLQIKFARLAVDTWTLAATRLHIIKDMRIFIGKMIWEGRFDANYMMIENDSFPRDQKRFL